MTVKQKITLREMYMIHIKIILDYPNDTDRIEKGFILMENFIDTCINNALNIAGAGAAIYHEGQKKGGSA